MSFYTIQRSQLNITSGGFFLDRNVYSYEKRKKELGKKKKKEQKRLLKLERKRNKEVESDPLADNPQDSESEQGE